MKVIFPIAGATLVLLDVLKDISTKTNAYLPIGGSHTAQMAIVLGLAYVVSEVVSVLRR